MRLVIEVVEIKGNCPVYKVGDRITLHEGYILKGGEPERICLHSLASVLPYYVALSRGIPAKDLGLARGDSEEAYLHCLDPCEITGGGTVIFALRRAT